MKPDSTAATTDADDATAHDVTTHDVTAHDASEDRSSDSADAVDLDSLLREFYPPPTFTTQLADFRRVDRVPSPYDQLLDHNKHMTVTVEAFHHEPVHVHVHRSHERDRWYSREITLYGQRSGRIVQYGIVRLNTALLAHAVWEQINARVAPLGRILIDHNVLREVQLCGLWKLTTGPCLAAMMHTAVGVTLYGRTALIHCDGEPAIELLEVVAAVR